MRDDRISFVIAMFYLGFASTVYICIGVVIGWLIWGM